MSFDTLPARGIGRSGAGAETIIGPSGGVSAVRLTLAYRFGGKVTRWGAAGATITRRPPPVPPSSGTQARVCALNWHPHSHTLTLGPQFVWRASPSTCRFPPWMQVAFRVTTSGRRWVRQVDVVGVVGRVWSSVRSERGIGSSRILDFGRRGRSRPLPKPLVQLEN